MASAWLASTRAVIRTAAQIKLVSGIQASLNLYNTVFFKFEYVKE